MGYVLKNLRNNKYLGDGDFIKDNKSEATVLDKEKATKYRDAFNTLNKLNKIELEEA